MTHKIICVTLLNYDHVSLFDNFIAFGAHLGRPIRTQESALFEIKTICYKRGFYAHYEKLRLASGVNI